MIMTAIKLRMLLAFVGALGGLSIYTLVEHDPFAQFPVAVQVLVFCFTIGFFPSFGMLAGVASPLRAASFAALVTFPGAAAIAWASTGFDNWGPIGDGIDTFPIYLLPFMLYVGLATPFAAAKATDPERWLDYEILFDIAWSMAVKAAAALVFLGVFWLIYFACDELLKVVGIRVLNAFFRTDWGAALLNGMVLGLTLAVIGEMDRVLSTLRFLVLLLLRLLLVPITIVMVIFVIMALVRGLGNAFAGMSATGTMIGMAAGALALIAATLDRDNEHATKSKVMMISVRVLAVLLPVVAGIAIYGLWLRIDQYGWTPTRMASLLLSGVVAIYAIGYGLNAILARGDWQGAIRRWNVWMALSQIVLLLAWISPVLNAEAISTNERLTRLMDGRISTKNLDLWTMYNEWGLAGKAGVVEIASLTDLPDADRIAGDILRLEDGESRYKFNQQRRADTNLSKMEKLFDRITVYPAGSVLPEVSELDVKRSYMFSQISAGCDKKLVDGRDGCVAIFVDLLPGVGGDEIVFIGLSQGAGRFTQTMMYQDKDGSWWSETVNSFGTGQGQEALRQLMDGEFELRPHTVYGIHVDGIKIIPARRN